MTALIAAFSWDWFADTRAFVVALIAATAANAIVLYFAARVAQRRTLESRMSKMEGEFGEVKAFLAGKIETLGTEIKLGGKALEAKIEAIPVAIESLKAVAKTQHASLDYRCASIATEIARQHAEMREHFVDCSENIIGPMKKKLDKVTVPV